LKIEKETFVPQIFNIQSPIENFQLKGFYIEKDRKLRRTYLIHPYPIYTATDVGQTGPGIRFTKGCYQGKKFWYLADL
jgi:hypothetical protein